MANTLAPLGRKMQLTPGSRGSSSSSSSNNVSSVPALGRCVYVRTGRHPSFAVHISVDESMRSEGRQDAVPPSNAMIMISTYQRRWRVHHNNPPTPASNGKHRRARYPRYQVGGTCALLASLAFYPSCA